MERAAAPPCKRWRVLRDPPGAAAWNMAVDEALARTLAPDEGVLRIYRWTRPTLSFGRNQPARERYDPAAIGQLGAQVVRRPTGGREVLHDRELTYAVVLGVRSLGGLRATFGVLNEALLRAVRSLDVAAALAGPERVAARPDAGACFEEATEGEVEVEGRKLVGSAQVRIGGSLLQHGSLLLGPPSIRLSALAAEGLGGRSLGGEIADASAAEGAEARAGPAAARTGSGQPGTSLSQVLGGPVAFERVAAAVEAAMAGTLGGRWERDDLRPDERRVAGNLVEDYESSSWTWRR